MKDSSRFWKELERTDRELNFLDHYELLGVSVDASVEEVRAGYEAKMRVLHPDQHRKATPDQRAALGRVIAAVGEAMRVLTGEAERRRYDSLRSRNQPGEAPPAPSRPRTATQPIPARQTGQVPKLTRRTHELLREALANMQSGPTPSADEPATRLRAKGSMPPPHQASSPSPAAKITAQTTSVAATSSEPRVEIACNGWANLEQLYNKSQSEQGLVLRCRTHAREGALVRVVLKLPNGKDFELSGNACTVGVDKNSGVRLRPMSDATRRRLAEILRNEGGLAVELPAAIAGQMVPVRVGRGTSAPVPVQATELSEAEALLRRGEFLQACKHLQLALSTRPDDAHLRALFFLASGLQARRCNQHEDAHRHFQRALHQAPDAEHILGILREHQV